MKKTHKTKSITCRIVSTGTVMQVNTIDEILSPGQYKIDACGVTASDGFPDGVEGECLSAYLEVSDTNHSADNLKSAAVGQTLTYTDADGDTAVYHRSGTNKDGKVEWSAWSDTAALGLQDGSITSEKLSKDIRTKIDSPLRSLFIAAGAVYNSATGFYELNGVKDLSESEILSCYNLKDLVYRLYIPRVAQSIKNLRTIFPITNMPQTSQMLAKSKFNASYSFYGSGLEIFRVNLNVSMDSNSLEDCLPCEGHFVGTFNNCTKLSKVYPIDLTNITSMHSPFVSCSLLEELRLINLHNNLDIKDSPIISKESISYIINNASPNSAITIILHPDAYTRLVNDADIVAALTEQPSITLVSA